MIPHKADLFLHFPDLVYFAKDKQGRFIAVNPAFLELIGAKSEAEILGKTDFDVWPRFLAENYVRDDKAVMASGHVLANKIELVIQTDRSTDWFATTKASLRNENGDIVGMEGISRYLKQSRTPLKPALEMSAVFTYIMENYHKKIEIPELAAMLSVSVKQFERKFKRDYGTGPMKYINRIRLDAACQLLVKTSLAISKIAMDSGFYDSSHFSNQFIKSIGLTPKNYREKHRRPEAPKLPELRTDSRR